MSNITLTIAPLCLYNNGIIKTCDLTINECESMADFHKMTASSLGQIKQDIENGHCMNVKPDELNTLYPVEEYIILDDDLPAFFAGHYHLSNGTFEYLKALDSGYTKEALRAFLYCIESNPDYFTLERFEAHYLGEYEDIHDFTEQHLTALHGNLEFNPLTQYLNLETVYDQHFQYDMPNHDNHFFTIRGNNH